MQINIYAYTSNDLENMIAATEAQSYISIAVLLQEYDSVEKLRNAASEEYDTCVLDLTNCINNERYYRIFVEQYLLSVIEIFDNIALCIHIDAIKDFKMKYPYIFRNSNFIYTSAETEEMVNISDKSPIKIFERTPLFIYETRKNIETLFNQNKVISLASLLTSYDGVNLKYNFDRVTSTIADTGVEFVDISTMMNAIRLRKDLIFQLEGLLVLIATNTTVKICVESSCVEDAYANFPCFFHEKNILENNMHQVVVDDKKADSIDVNQINNITQMVSERLKGHADFKSDFQKNLVKFLFLNQLKERKLLSLLLCGDSGVGKTEFAKILSNAMFPDEDLIKINFGNYSNEGVLNSLIGSPLGYVGSEEGGELVNKISASKSKIILIDEFEKATPSVFNFFYELLEDGKFTDRHGTAHNLSGYIIVFTSNMSQKQYTTHIPDSLKSRFDMVYYFIDIPDDEKLKYIAKTADSLAGKLKEQFSVDVDISAMNDKLAQLVKYKNLRDIKREIEDIIFKVFFESYSSAQDN